LRLRLAQGDERVTMEVLHVVGHLRSRTEAVRSPRQDGEAAAQVAARLRLVPFLAASCKPSHAKCSFSEHFTWVLRFVISRSSVQV
jgi:hypothetical protein